MYSCEEIGQKRADEVLLRVPLQLNEQNSDLKVDPRIRAGDIVGVLKDVNKTCFEYKREIVRRTVCRVRSHLLDVQFRGAISLRFVDCRPSSCFR